LADLYDDHASTAATEHHFRLRPTGTDAHAHL
jgi:hypothetical protein